MKKYIFMILLLLIGFAGGFFGALYIDYLGGTTSSIIMLLACLVIAAYFQIIIHEGGHLIFGLLTGYGFVSFRIGSLMIYKKQGKFQFGKYSLAGTGGQCLMSPPEMKDGKMPYVLYNLGGVLLNLIVSLLCIATLMVTELSILMSCFCVMMAAIGIIFVITNGVPMRVGEVDNDGCNALSMGKTPDALRSLWLQLKVNEKMTEGIRLKDMPDEWFAMPEEEKMQNSMVAAIDVVQIVKTMKNFPSVLRTQYAYALLEEKDLQKVEKIKSWFEKMAKSYPYPQEIESDWELMKGAE